jgi:hypothetical protein
MGTRAMMAGLCLWAVACGACTSSSVSSSGAHEEYNQLTGNLTSTLEAPLDRAYEAAQAALDDLQFTTTDKSKDALQALLSARMADKSTVRVTLEKKSDRVTEATVGVGTFGKEGMARIVMEKIRARLR